MKLFEIRSWYQINLFICMYIGYMLYIFNRKSFSFVIPTIVEKDKIDRTQVGTILTSIATAYAIGKFVSGILVDRFSPRLMFAFGLFFTGISNVLYSISSFSFFAIIAFFNGLSQGPGWPACGKILRRWYSPTIFGTLWSTLSTSMNVPASLGPVLCTAYISWSGGSWRPVMMIGGTISCVFALVFLVILKDRPEDVGLTLDMLSSEKQKNKRSEVDYHDKDIKQSKSIQREKSKSNETQQVAKQNAWKRIFSSPYTYVIVFGFLVSNFTRSVIYNWGGLYLIQEKKSSQYFSGLFTAWFEFGGICGSVITGYFSDMIVSSRGIKGKGHPRHLLLIFWYIILFCSMYGLRTKIYDVNNQQLLTHALAFLCGFCVYGNISLNGVLAIETAASDISGTSHAFAALFGNVGMMISGLPFSKIMELLSWDEAFLLCEMLVTAVTVVFITSQWLTCRIGDLVKQD